MSDQDPDALMQRMLDDGKPDDEILAAVAKLEAGEGEPAPESDPSEATPPAEAANQQADQAPADDQAPAADEPPKQKMVPHQALHEARENAKTLRTENQQLQQRISKMEDRFQDIMDRMTRPQQPAQPGTPDKDAIIAEFAMKPHEAFDALAGAVRDLQTAQQKQASAEEQARHQQNITGQVAMIEQQFATDHPDYWDAYQHVLAKQYAEVLATGLNPVEAQQQVRQRQMAFVQAAVANGVNPAQAAYDLAKSTYGFVSKTPPANGEGQPGQQAGQQPGGQGGDQSEDPAQKLARIKRMQDASVSMSRGGDARRFNTSLESLADMDGEEFDRAWAEHVGSVTGMNNIWQ